MTPFGLIRNTWPFDCSAPRIWLGSCPVMRFSTALSALCWTKRVTSPALTEKLCQLMIALGVFVIVNTLPCWPNVAWPLTTVRHRRRGLGGAEAACHQHRDECALAYCCSWSDPFLSRRCLRGREACRCLMCRQRLPAAHGRSRAACSCLRPWPRAGQGRRWRCWCFPVRPAAPCCAFAVRGVVERHRAALPAPAARTGSGVYSSRLAKAPESADSARSSKPRTDALPPAPNCSPGTSASPVNWPLSSRRACQSCATSARDRRRTNAASCRLSSAPARGAFEVGALRRGCRPGCCCSAGQRETGSPPSSGTLPARPMLSGRTVTSLPKFSPANSTLFL